MTRAHSDPGPSAGLPHEHDRERGQPYAKEQEDYARGVAKPPKEQVGNTSDTSSRRGERDEPRRRAQSERIDE